jgi:hypothetical protein
MSTDAIPTIDPTSEASLSDRERAVLAACRAILERGGRLTFAALAAELRNSSDWVIDAYRRLGMLGLIPWRGRGQPRKAAPVPGPDGLTDLERACLDACIVLAPGRARLTQGLIRERVARRGPDVGVALRRLVALGRLDADTLLPLSPRAPIAAPPARGEAGDPDTARRPRPVPRDHDGPCHEAVADYRRAWGRIRTLLPRGGSSGG